MYNWAKTLNLIELIIFTTFCVFFVVQMVYYLRVYLPVLFYKDTQPNEKPLPLSVIICARNEAENLQKNLKYVLEQNHPDYEVIVVNDSSTDESDNVLGGYLREYKHLKTTSLPAGHKFTHGKKLALTVGIKAAKNEYLVFTDADCRPVSENWLTEIQTGFINHDIVLAYGGYKRRKSFLNNYIRFDTLFIALQYLGFAIARSPYMGVGRNLAYKKELFFKNKGFANHYGLLSGDDDLFINEVANKSNTTVVIGAGSFTRSEPKTSLKAFFEQKLRHLSTASKYRKKHVFLLGLEPLSRLWFYTLFAVLLTMQNFLYPLLVMFMLRFFTQLYVFAKAGKKFKEKNIWISFIIFDIVSLFFNFIAYTTLSIRGRKIRWK
ncbi:MAG: glycosyltransferase [Bacteroidales bacterium]|nr:glycosyltransferase [Bacteroidales bacterium]